MTSLRPVLAGYRMVRFGSCACLPSICVQSLPTAHSSVVVWRLACTVYRSFFDLLCELLFDFPLPLGVGLFVTKLYISFGPFLDCPHFLPYHSVISAIMTQSCWASLGLPFILSPVAKHGHWFSYSWAPVSLFFFLLGIIGPFAFFGLP